MVPLLTCWLLVVSAVSPANSRVHRPTHTRADIAQHYLQTLRLSLTGELLQTDTVYPGEGTVETLKKLPFDAHMRENGLDWPMHGLTMVGSKRLENIEHLLTDVVEADIPGDFVECGVWRGGSSLFARAVLNALGVHDRVVHLVDSFEGLPAATQSKDDDRWSRQHFLKVSLEQVQNPLRMLGLLDHGVAFHKGFFQHTLPLLRQQFLANDKKIALLRMDGDMFESTMDILFNLYDLVSLRGCVIVDDYTVPEAKEAVEQFLRHHGVLVDFVPIDPASAYFCKEKEITVDTAWYARFNENRTQPHILPAP